MQKSNPVRVLLIDDEQDFVIFLGKRLAMRGLHVETAFDGPEGLAKLDAGPVDVIVLDQMMPGMSGLEVLEQAKKTHPEVEVILQVGVGSAALGIEGMRLGAADFLTKPPDFEALCLAIQAAAERRR